MQIAGVHTIFLQTPRQDAKGQACAIDRHIDLFEHVRQCAYMIFMAVGQHYGLDFVLIFNQVGYIRYDQINAQHILIGEHQAGIYDQYLVIYTYNRHVLADFTQSAQGNNL